MDVTENVSVFSSFALSIINTIWEASLLFWFIYARAQWCWYRVQTRTGVPRYFWGGGLSPHLMQCGLSLGLPPYQVPSWSVLQFGHMQNTWADVGAAVPLSWWAVWAKILGLT